MRYPLLFSGGGVGEGSGGGGGPDGRPLACGGVVGWLHAFPSSSRRSGRSPCDCFSSLILQSSRSWGWRRSRRSSRASIAGRGPCRLHPATTTVDRALLLGWARRWRLSSGRHLLIVDGGVHRNRAASLARRPHRSRLHGTALARGRGGLTSDAVLMPHRSEISSPAIVATGFDLRPVAGTD
jgi:hypothetical protein